MEATPEQAAERLKKLEGAVATILECVGEDPDREGLRRTPERYARAMLFFTKGYEENVRDLMNGAVFHEDHDELVMVKDIEIFSLCEHHMVPFTGKVSLSHLTENLPTSPFESNHEFQDYFERATTGAACSSGSKLGVPSNELRSIILLKT